MRAALVPSLALMLCLGGTAACCPSQPAQSPSSVSKGTDPVNEQTTPDASDPAALAKRPELSAPTPYQAPEPQVYTSPQGITVWLIERPAVPVVTVSMTLRRGSADDPAGKEGLSHITTSMLDEGAGERNAIEIAEAIDELGATLFGGSSLDGSHITLSVVKKHLDKAFGVFADVVARPSFDPKEFSRTSKLWQHRLAKRQDNPNAVASLVARAVVYGPDTPYGHPASGRVSSAAGITLDDVKGFYRDAWRPDQAMLIAAGAISRAELDALIDKTLGSWKAPDDKAAAPVTLPPPRSQRPRLVMVDRPGAPQTVIAVSGPGVAAASEPAQLLDLVNTALGGSFTSRLNQNLREDRGWTYGVRSAFMETRGQGPFVVRTAVETGVTGAALKEILGEIDKMASKGLTDNEYIKVRARDLTETIETHETSDGLVGRLSHLAMMGLPVSYDAQASHTRQSSSQARLAELARTFLDTSKLSIILVGPKDTVLPQLDALSLGDPELWTAEGRPQAAKAGE